MVYDLKIRILQNMTKCFLCILLFTTTLAYFLYKACYTSLTMDVSCTLINPVLYAAIGESVLSLGEH